MSSVRQACRSQGGRHGCGWGTPRKPPSRKGPIGPKTSADLAPPILSCSSDRRWLLGMDGELAATPCCQPRILGEIGKRLRSLLAVELVEQRLRKRIVDLTPEPSQLIVPDPPSSCRDRSSNVPALSFSH